MGNGGLFGVGGLKPPLINKNPPPKHTMIINTAIMILITPGRRKMGPSTGGTKTFGVPHGYQFTTLTGVAVWYALHSSVAT